MSETPMPVDPLPTPEVERRPWNRFLRDHAQAFSVGGSVSVVLAAIFMLAAVCASISVLVYYREGRDFAANVAALQQARAADEAQQRRLDDILSGRVSLNGARINGAGDTIETLSEQLAALRVHQEQMTAAINELRAQRGLPPIAAPNATSDVHAAGRVPHTTPPTVVTPSPPTVPPISPSAAPLVPAVRATLSPAPRHSTRTGNLCL